MSEHTRAALFQRGSEVEMLARFSTVAGEQGSPDTWRDPRGFALKFYTPEGNYDLVGNNTPVFFIRDTMKFPHFIRSQKRRGTGLRDNNMQWDFWTLNPESAHQVTYLMGDRGIPRSWRFMNGYGSHTYMWINAAGRKTWVKYHFHTDQGVEGLSDEDASIIAGEDADFHRRDLFDAIASGDAPSWTLSVQLMPYEDAATYRLNPFDLTKIWPHSDYPLVEVGRMTLDRNYENFFAEIEQAAFEPSALVPGIGFSPDKMLLGRAFAYADTHRYRIGTNYHQLPVNLPRAVPELNTYTFDGAMTFEHTGDAPVYAPNSFGRGYADEIGVVDESWESDGEMVRQAYTLRADDDDWSQPGALVREVFDDQQRDRFVKAVASHLLADVTGDVLERAFDYWRHVDEDSGKRIESLVRRDGDTDTPGADASSAAQRAEANANRERRPGG
jgi:catalase